ncbi:uncharacterized protein [Chanodichthys erythropterus]|uniref:uncharacterized protein n=1 Tax=Chanodichthys erythropterus TaxID=933992 RepID=UPI00351E93B0
MVDKLRSGLFTPRTNLLLEAVFLTAYYGFLKGGEFTINTKKFDPSHDLTVKDISFHTEYFSIYLKHSKTDRDNNGSTINISRTNDRYCPLTAMNQLVSSRSKSNPTDPLSLQRKGEAMSKHWFASRLHTACLHCGMDPTLYTSHSFRIGVATTAASTVSIPMLKAMGRWSSSANGTSVFGDEEKSVSVWEGDSVTLNSDLTEMKDDDVIQWRFENTLIAEINVTADRFTVYDDVLEGRLRDRLKLDNQTGSLTITGITTEVSGDYRLKISSVEKFFFVFVKISVIMGDSVTLDSDLTEMKDDDVIQWRFENTLIAEINVTADRITVYDDVLDGRFRDRLKLDKQIGSLTITNTTDEHAGDYKREINSVEKNFTLVVFVEISVKEGDSVTLNSDLTEMKDDDVIQWRHGYENTLIAEINVTDDRITVYDDVLDGRFRDRLKLDNQTGSLTITNTRTEHTAVFKLQINKMISVTSVCVKYESVKEGDSVTLNSDLTEMKDDDVIQWRFGSEDTLIALINKRADRITVYDDVLDGRFRDRLKLDNQTESLTITNFTTEHAGDYVLLINSVKKTFRLNVFENTKKLTVKEGDSVTLNSDLTEMKDDDVIQWRFRNTLIAEINVTADRITVYDDVLDGRFRDRLKLDKQTGSLTITDTRTEHAGDYVLEINSVRKFFILFVFDEISVKEGDSVTLNSDLTEMKNGDRAHWWFSTEITLIAEINKRVDRITVYDDVLDGRFRDRLKLDNQTGSLTITDITTEHTGDYKLEINREWKIFILNVFVTISVKEGDSVTLNSDLTEMKDDDVIQWRFGNTLIAEINKRVDRITVYDDVLDGRFRDRLKLDNQTGSLTITNITTEHTGDYELQTKSVRKFFVLLVFVEISVKEGDSVTLNSDLTEMKDDDVIQWRFGNTLIAEIKKRVNNITVYDVFDGRFRDRLKMDNQTGSLTITNFTTEHAGDYVMMINGAKRSSKAFRVSVYDSVHCCGPTEAVIRLVLSALVGVATVILLVYDIRSRRAEQHQAHINTSET